MLLPPTDGASIPATLPPVEARPSSDPIRPELVRWRSDPSTATGNFGGGECAGASTNRVPDRFRRRDLLTDSARNTENENSPAYAVSTSCFL